MTYNVNSSSSNNNNNKSLTECPFSPKPGYTTAAVYTEYAVDNPLTAPNMDIRNEYALMANMDTNEPLYFWQLYSLLGPAPIRKLVTDFYQRVFDDDEAPWFRDEFVALAPLERHIAVQTAYWIDAMGGGRCYHGGEYRLHFHHEHNAATIMTAAGARRWMYHMRHALETTRFSDPRVKPAILDFLTTKMKSYADQFKWDFDENDMVLYQDDNNSSLQ